MDKAIEELYHTGYMHNHMRMYVASISCNVANSYWLNPAKWLYFHLLDGDLASNHLSWQWVAGAFANKKYYANQENINKYFSSRQNGTFLDVSYTELATLDQVEVLQETVPFELRTTLPHFDRPSFSGNRKTLVYNYYNLDPNWHKDEDVQRVLLLEPGHFEKYPVSQKNIDFVLQLAKNIEGMKVFVGAFDDLAKEVAEEHIIYKEHPTSKHYRGTREERDWLSSAKGYFPSFFKFWKKAKKELQSL